MARPFFTQRPLRPSLHSASDLQPSLEVALLGGSVRGGQAAVVTTLEGTQRFDDTFASAVVCDEGTPGGGALVAGATATSLVRAAGVVQPKPLPKTASSAMVVRAEDRAFTGTSLYPMLLPVLTRHGAEVHAARSADEAMRLAEATWPEIVVADIEMPTEGGFTLIQGLLELESRSSARPCAALALTGRARRQDRLRALASGYRAHVVKPVVPEDLVAAIGRLVCCV
jgi:CheY-like chemotaxis protein